MVFLACHSIFSSPFTDSDSSASEWVCMRVNVCACVRACAFVTVCPQEPAQPSQLHQICHKTWTSAICTGSYPTQVTSFSPLRDCHLTRSKTNQPEFREKPPEPLRNSLSKPYSMNVQLICMYWTRRIHLDLNQFHPDRTQSNHKIH